MIEKDDYKTAIKHDDEKRLAHRIYEKVFIYSRTYSSVGKMSFPVLMALTSAFAYCMMRIAVPTVIPSHSCTSLRLKNSNMSCMIQIKPFFFSRALYGENTISS
jgi:hypothetical protein